MGKRRTTIVLGFLLFAVGAILLVEQLRPGIFQPIMGSGFTWPWFIIGTGVIFLLTAILGGAGGLAIPGSIVTTVGLILYYQNQTNDWESWAFAWALIPASVGLGIVLTSLIDGKIRSSRPGFWLLITNLIIFVVFMALFRRNSEILIRYWPVLVIVLGILILVQGLWPKKQ